MLFMESKGGNDMKHSKALCVLVALMIALCGVLPAQADQANRAMGRYMEKELPYPSEDNIGYVNFSQINGKTYGLTADGSTINISDDLEKWARQSSGHDEKNQPLNGDLRGFGVDANGAVYLMGWYQDGKNYFTLVERIKDGKSERMPLELKQKDSGQNLMSMQVLPDGGILGSSSDGVMRFSPDGKLAKQYPNTADTEFTASAEANELAVWSYTNKTVTIYDLASGQSKRELPLPIAPTDAMLFKYDSNGALYLACAQGVYRVNAGGTLWEQIVDGSLTTLGKPSASLQALLFDKDGNPVIVFWDKQSQKMSVIAYRYDAAVPTEPTQTLNVLTLYENETLKQAANQFQQAHPEAKVQITVALPEGTAITRDDAIRTLNTELMAGKGPDVLALDGLPVRDYIEKGILADLTDMVKPMIDANQLLPNVVSTFTQDGATRAVPTRFLLPTIWGDVGGLNTLDDLAAWAKTHTDTLPFFGTDPEQLIGTFYLSSAPAWFDENGRLRQDVIETFLTDLKDIRGKWTYEEVTKLIGMDLKANGMPPFSWNPYVSAFGVMGSMEESGGMSFLCSGLQAYLPFLMRGENSMQMPNGAIADVKKGTFALLPGQVKNAFVPSLVLGAPKDGACLDLAKNFIKIALGDETQAADLSDGLPVNMKALDNEQARKQSTVGTFSSSLRSGGSYSSRWPDKATRDALRAEINALATPVVPDFTLYRMIVEESAPFFEGQMDASQAAANVVNKANAYLSE
jgi:ABC-type glycerol-3-phosphate transport system substrate-binding protein